MQTYAKLCINIKKYKKNVEKWYKSKNNYCQMLKNGITYTNIS